MLKTDTRYTGTITVAGLYETERGTLGYQLGLSCEDGNTEYTIWLTPKAKENALKAFKALGIEAEALKTEAGFDGIESRLVGMEVAFGTKTEEWNGKQRIKVAWVGKPKAEATGDVKKRAAAFFAGDPIDPNEPVPF